MDGKESYRAGVRYWLAGDLPHALAVFDCGAEASDQRFRAICQGFVGYLTARGEEQLLQALQQLANAELLGFSDFPMFFAVGHIAWQLTGQPCADDVMTKALLLDLGQRCFHAVNVEMPKPMLHQLERHHDLSAAYLADQLGHELNSMRHRYPQTGQLLDKLICPEVSLSGWLCQLELDSAPEQLCLLDRLLLASLFMSRRLLRGQPAELAAMLAAT